MSAQSEPIEFEWNALTAEQVANFEAATHSQHTARRPPTLATLFRWGEFKWLERMQVDMRRLLHTEQEYRFLTPDGSLPLGKPFHITTRLAEVKEKRGLRFVTLSSTVLCDKIPVLESETRFVVRTEGPST